MFVTIRQGTQIIKFKFQSSPTLVSKVSPETVLELLPSLSPECQAGTFSVLPRRHRSQGQLPVSLAGMSALWGSCNDRCKVTKGSILVPRALPKCSLCRHSCAPWVSSTALAPVRSSPPQDASVPQLFLHSSSFLWILKKSLVQGWGFSSIAQALAW